MADQGASWDQSVQPLRAIEPVHTVDCCAAATEGLGGGLLGVPIGDQEDDGGVAKDAGILGLVAELFEAPAL